MKKGMTTWLIVGGAVVLIGAVGFFLLRKPKEKATTGGGDVTPMPNTNDDGGGVVVSNTPIEKPFENMGFVQKSNTPFVSILKDPTLFSGVVKKVESFTSTYARPSSKNGWWEVSDDGVTTIGYVPNGVLRKI
jgi:LPXTG-motif cell wall-anchored protein